MKHFTFFLTISILFFLFLNNCCGETEFRKAGTFDIRLYGGTSSGSSYFDLNEKQMIKMSEKIENETPTKDYTVEFSELYFGIRAEYSVTDNFTVFGEIPLNSYNLLEKYLADSLGYRSTRGDFSLLQTDYFAIGGRYLLYQKRTAFMAFYLEGRMPHRFYNGIQTDPDYQFLSDGAFELITGAMFGLKLEKMNFESSIFYNIRGEDLVDQYIIHTKAGLSTVPGTELRLTIDFLQSTKSFKNAVPFDPRKTILQENNIKIGFGFNMMIDDAIYADFCYRITPIGKNSWSLGTFYLACGVIF
ncbi:MAG: hypothetical protein WCT77_02850 [Bacteroidota bacterium]|jgi:hypothetical protein